MAVNFFESDRDELKAILDIEKKYSDIDGFHQFLEAMKKYGIEGEFDFVINEEHIEDCVKDPISIYLILNSLSRFTDIGHEFLPYLAECLEPFLARAKLDYASYSELPDYLSQARAICADNAGANELMKIHPDFLTVKELSILWNMTEEAIRNDVLSKPDIKSKLKKFGQLIGVPGELAFELSKQRQGFKASRIQVIDNPSVRLVPVDSNGEAFSKECCNSKGYRIGRKGKEETIRDYEIALQKLVEMVPKPYWRRKNKNGNWGIVAGVSWTTEPIE